MTYFNHISTILYTTQYDEQQNTFCASPVFICDLNFVITEPADIPAPAGLCNPMTVIQNFDEISRQTYTTNYTPFPMVRVG